MSSRFHHPCNCLVNWYWNESLAFISWCNEIHSCTSLFHCPASQLLLPFGPWSLRCLVFFEIFGQLSQLPSKTRGYWCWIRRQRWVALPTSTAGHHARSLVARIKWHKLLKRQWIQLHFSNFSAKTAFLLCQHGATIGDRNQGLWLFDLILVFGSRVSTVLLWWVPQAGWICLHHLRDSRLSSYWILFCDVTFLPMQQQLQSISE